MRAKSMTLAHFLIPRLTPRPTLILGALLSLTLGAASLALAGTEEEAHAHFTGLPAATLSEALTNLAEYNERLRAYIDRGEIAAQEYVEVHELTYTLENALGKLNEELAALADTLEEVHVASEQADAEALLDRGRAYLEVADQIVKAPETRSGD